MQADPATEAPYRVLLYYRFVSIPDPEAVREAHEALCRRLELRGRILIAAEGINGTVSGTTAHTLTYMETLNADPLFRGMEFKVDPHDGHAFHKLHVRVRPEILHFGEPLRDQPVAPYIEPDEMLRILEENPDDVVIVDARSDYEFQVGRFRNAQTIDIRYFRELRDRLGELEDLKDRQIITYCTGGIRCEKLTAVMLREGFHNVRQLHGGIIRYAHETGGKYFDGQCYVFDDRVTVPVNQVNPTVIGQCGVCQAPTERMINCANADCNRHFLICDSCFEQLEGCCSDTCTQSSRRREFNPAGHYHRGVNSKRYMASPSGKTQQGQAS